MSAETDTIRSLSDYFGTCAEGKHCWENVYHQCKSYLETVCCKCGYQMPLSSDYQATEKGDLK